MFVAALCVVIVVTPTAANAAYYNTYTTVATLGNAEGCTIDEGFTTGTTYAYSAKINDVNNPTKEVLYRTNMSDGTTTLMTNGDNGTDYATYLNHANDITLMSNGGNYYMYIVTLAAGSLSMVKLQYVGTTYYKVGSYTIAYNGSNITLSGVAITSKDASYVYFLFKNGHTFYDGSLGLTQSSGTINVFHAFDVNVKNAPVNGVPVSGVENWATQGIYDYLGTLYYPVTQDNVSIVFVFNAVNTASGTITPDNNLSFRITSSAYPDQFEIEGVGFAGSKLWFSANRRTAPGDTAHDGVFYFNGYAG